MIFKEEELKTIWRAVEGFYLVAEEQPSAFIGLGDTPPLSAPEPSWVRELRQAVARLPIEMAFNSILGHADQWLTSVNWLLELGMSDLMLQAARKKLEQVTLRYHITSLEAWNSIKVEGLKPAASRGRGGNHDKDKVSTFKGLSIEHPDFLFRLMETYCLKKKLPAPNRSLVPDDLVLIRINAPDLDWIEQPTRSNEMFTGNSKLVVEGDRQHLGIYSKTRDCIPAECLTLIDWRGENDTRGDQGMDSPGIIRK